MINITNNRVKDILAEDELSKVHEYNKKIMDTSTKMQIDYYGHEIDQIIEGAKKRYYIVKKHIKSWAPNNLRGAFGDEYDNKVLLVTKAILEVKDKKELAAKVKEVFENMLMKDFDYENCLYVADVILKDLNSETENS